ncbi:uncharacterized protein C8R40DRAFT_1066293 [Lentinula edodes]|uniref:uncharacterized protein n=1 Tax=Lentinula edodes TaxID=5353 RepID=UPI001E8D5779|nr:uncharacterized protein C8R40DRAFT_1066293 [Lentinula edodes]KAH7879169.1 hypothetical protein C8R40DRAFT_1066293 [Lentinula edodes]
MVQQRPRTVGSFLQWYRKPMLEMQCITHNSPIPHNPYLFGGNLRYIFTITHTSIAIIAFDTPKMGSLQKEQDPAVWSLLPRRVDIKVGSRLGKSSRLDLHGGVWVKRESTVHNMPCLKR